MKENFEIEKELKFKSNIAEVTSISLEEKHEVSDGYLVGNFIVSGDYRIHEISLNKEKFNYKVPFKHEIKNDIDSNTIDVEVTNFIYDTDNDSLFATINYDIIGDRKDILLFDDDENLEDFLKSREVEIIMDDLASEIDDVLENTDKDIDIPALKNEIKEEIVKVLENDDSKTIEEVEEVLEENNEIDERYLEDTNRDETKEEIAIMVENKMSDKNKDETKDNFLKSVNVEDDNYITYKIHIVKSEDSLESILANYKISIDELKEYNEINTLQLGDKLIIPIINEE